MSKSGLEPQGYPHCVFNGGLQVPAFLVTFWTHIFGFPWWRTLDLHGGSLWISLFGFLSLDFSHWNEAKVISSFGQFSGFTVLMKFTKVRLENYICCEIEKLIFRMHNMSQTHSFSDTI